MKSKCLIMIALTVGMLSSLIFQQALAEIILDRSKIIFDGGQKSIYINLKNIEIPTSLQIHGWIEDEKGNKVHSPLMVIPSMLRVDTDKSYSIEIKSQPAVKLLRQDQETMFYFNLQGVIQKNSKLHGLGEMPKVRVKLFYRPPAIKLKNSAYPLGAQLNLLKKENGFMIQNLTPYHVDLVSFLLKNGEVNVLSSTESIIKPKDSLMVVWSGEENENNPMLTYVNDDGSEVRLTFSCKTNDCIVISESLNK